MKNFVITAALFLSSTFAFAASGLTYETGGGVGYIHQTEKCQFKVMADYFRSSDNGYEDSANFKLSYVHDIAKVDDISVYTGLGIWSDYSSSAWSLLSNRFDAILGARHQIGNHWQAEIFVNGLSYQKGNTVTYDGHKTVAATGVYLARSGSVALAYLF